MFLGNGFIKIKKGNFFHPIPPWSLFYHTLGGIEGKVLGGLAGFKRPGLVVY